MEELVDKLNSADECQNTLMDLRLFCKQLPRETYYERQMNVKVVTHAHVKWECNCMLHTFYSKYMHNNKLLKTASSNKLQI